MKFGLSFKVSMTRPLTLILIPFLFLAACTSSSTPQTSPTPSSVTTPVSSPSPQSSPSANPSTSPISSPIPTPPSGTPAIGAITASPQSGPVGTKVTISGSGCANPGMEPVLVFGPQSGVSSQAVSIGAIKAGTKGQFQITYTIPSSLTFSDGSSYSVKPDTYLFYSPSPNCWSLFTVKG